MAIYDTEEEQVEQLKKWWEANNTSLIAGVFTAILLVTGWNFWQNHQLEQRSEASRLYQNLLAAAAKNESASVEKLADQLAVEHGSQAYAHFAGLAKAKTKVDAGDLEAAKAILQQQVRNDSDEALQHVARLRLIQLLLASGQYEEGLKLIAAVDPAKAEGFAASYDELEGDLYVALDRLDEARTAYQNAVRTGQATAFTQFKLDDIAAPAFNPAAANLPQ
ncbi:tetratricopeptide repeat protein [Methylomonas sp. SURF-2]|uniref:Ancillary SecYEG translocon subunit n=1 Tax=Methylomonas subterranea TaxID=2952225 RepID=A0ABT1THG8_9GAMM|nr:tetratricopeptide repeat protein [Methylomonas sp. SURF-2]